MSRLDHPIPGEWLTAYYDGELDAARRDQVRAHLPQCAECRRELAELEALSQTLAADALPLAAGTGPVDFWRGVQSQLPDRRPAQPIRTPLSARGILLRWSPGIGLLLLNGVVQVAAVAATALMLIVSPLSGAPGWATWSSRLAADLTLGWAAWLLPAGWSGVGVFLFWVSVSAALAVLYLAWLGYELRYGDAASGGRAIAGSGA